MIDVGKAAKIASDYMKGFFPETETIRLEEVELTEDREYWYITLSYSEDIENSLVNPFIVSGNKTRKYKIFKIETETGTVLSMKIREFK